ncbi:MAG: GNAT family N-acetyltransferase [Myxococcales bacterium]
MATVAEDLAGLACASKGFRVLDASVAGDLDRWRQLWQAWPERDVMAHPDYARLFARPCDRVVAALSEEEQGAVLFPLILRPLSAEPWAGAGESRWDAVSPYGYGGPFAWGSRARNDERFWEGYRHWCQRERVVATFSRLSLFPELLASIPEGSEERGRNVVARLEGGFEAVARAFDSRVRRWVGVAEGAGLIVECDQQGERLDEFLAVYAHTMKRKQASAWYLFPRAFFEAIVDRLAGSFAFFHTVQAGRVLASELVLYSPARAYFFLGGTYEDAYPLGPNYLLKDRALRWAVRQGLQAFVLGGGHQPNDGLLLYKRAFTGRKGLVPFRVACLTHDATSCEELEAARARNVAQQGGSWGPEPGFFPRYRA